jgi:ribosomal protein S18 acetylase RimI-like enzyme
MAASAVIGSQDDQSFNGLRPIRIKRDLAAIADLIELCFAPTMDESGRAAIREMRMISQSGPLLSLFYGLDRLLGGLEQGFVWLESGRVVGNISISPAGYPRPLGTGHIIANVAVHPEYRGRGLGQALVRAALDFVRQKGGDFAILQVEARNADARHIYTKLGFREERTFVRWYRPSFLHTPRPLPAALPILPRRPYEWRAELELAELVRPNRQGGMGWLQPTHPRFFRESWWQSLIHALTGQIDGHWVVRDANGRGLAASLQISMSFGGPNCLTLLVHPDYQGQLEAALLNFALRQTDNYGRPVQIEHPLDDAVTTALLSTLSFERRNTLVHMRHDLV